MTQEAPGRGLAPSFKDDVEVGIPGFSASAEILHEDRILREDRDDEDDPPCRSGNGIEVWDPQPVSSILPNSESGPADDRRHERLEALAHEIASQLQRLATAARTGFDAKFKLGLYLVEARELCRRGEWTQFLESHGIKPRIAQESIQFVNHRDLLEANAHDRAPWTTEEARTLISSHRKAIGKGRRRRPASQQGLETIDQRDRGVATGNQGRADQPGGDTTDAADREPIAPHSDSPSADLLDSASTAAPAQSAAKDRCGDDVAELDEPAATTKVDDPSASGHDEGRQQASAPIELSDEEWLAAIPLRQELSHPCEFDRDAILWRRAQPLLAQLCELLEPSPEEIGRSNSYRLARNRLRLRLLFAIRVKLPRDWRVCLQCRGHFTDRPGTMPCSGCDGRGFVITHDGESPEADRAG